MISIPGFSGTILSGEPMSRHSTMKVGGSAPALIEPSDEESLSAALRSLGAGARFFVLGGGSNSIFPDEIDFPVISTKKLSPRGGRILLSGGGGGTAVLTVSAGASWGEVCAFCKKRRISAFAPFSGLPGTVGGALFMNATCFGLSACDLLVSVRTLRLRDLSIRETPFGAEKERLFAYKKSPFQGKSEIILSASFAVEIDEASSEHEVSERYDGFLRERAAKKHFSAPSAGSVFKNDSAAGIVAGKAIDECGLKGTRIGGGEIPEWHGNFIVNRGGASAKDVHDLVNLVKSTVEREKHIELSCEILFVEENLWSAPPAP